nr:hypothetical protein [Calditrichia bacterium]
FKVWSQLILRSGYAAGYEARNFSVGIGLRKSFFHLDYSYTPFQDDLGDRQLFSLYLSL